MTRPRSDGPPAELLRLSEEIGRFIHYWGFKQVHGRIWTQLYLSEEALDAAELMSRLGISKALVSMSLAELVEHDVVVESSKGPRGTLLYKANPDVVDVILKVVRRREKEMLAHAREAIDSVDALPAETRERWKLSSERLGSLSEFVQSAQEVLGLALQLRSEDLVGLKNFLAMAREDPPED